MEIQEDTWIWVVIQDPDKSEALLGQYDEKNDISFIPAFTDKNNAEDCMGLLVKDEGKKYELQAMQYKLLMEHASSNNFMIFFLDSNGNILDRIDPSDAL